jgi:hypothetical protein
MTMTDREKVIKGLECCMKWTGEPNTATCHCSDCSYTNMDILGQRYLIDLINDALALLKEQEAEARLLTAEEVQNMEAGTAFGIETYYDHDGERMPGCAWALRTERLILSYFGTMFPDTVTKIPYNTLEENQNTGKHEKHQYRFWSKKPTFEQCKAVKWE